MQELENKKVIYQKGSLRKKVQGISEVRVLDLKISTIEHSDLVQVRDAMRDSRYNLQLLESIDQYDALIPHKVVVCQSSKLAGDYVKHMCTDQYGLLMACFSSKRTKKDYCLIN